jgi:hypothetical protein
MQDRVPYAANNGTLAQGWRTQSNGSVLDADALGIGRTVEPEDTKCLLQSVSRSVCGPAIAFDILRCHPWPCMLLNLGLRVNSSPT